MLFNIHNELVFRAYKFPFYRHHKRLRIYNNIYYVVMYENKIKLEKLRERASKKERKKIYISNFRSEFVLTTMNKINDIKVCEA